MVNLESYLSLNYCSYQLKRSDFIDSVIAILLVTDRPLELLILKALSHTARFWLHC